MRRAGRSLREISEALGVSDPVLCREFRRAEEAGLLPKPEERAPESALPAQIGSTGNKDANRTVQGSVRRLAAVISASVVGLVLAACGGEETGPPATAPTALERIDNEEAIRLISSCEASSVISLHSGDWHLRLKNDRSLLIPNPDPPALQATAHKAMESGCEMAIGTE
jgi:hypothetical protein